MDKAYEFSDWKLKENAFDPGRNQASEALFSLGNGWHGHRGIFEEHYSGPALGGHFVSGIGLVPTSADKLEGERWLRASNWTGIEVEVDGRRIDLAKCEILSFHRTLHFDKGYLEREVELRTDGGYELKIRAIRFCSYKRCELGVIRYAVVPLNFSGTLTLTPYIGADAYGETPGGLDNDWLEVESRVRRTHACLLTETRDHGDLVCTGMKFAIDKGGKAYDFNSYRLHREKYVGCSVDMPCEEGKKIVLYKFAVILSSSRHGSEKLMKRCRKMVKKVAGKGYSALLKEQVESWKTLWKQNGLEIGGDELLQNALRLSQFHLWQHWRASGEAGGLSRSGFSGNLAGGHIDWQAEVFGLPYMLTSRGSAGGSDMIHFRLNHLNLAQKRAEHLGYASGAAFYPARTVRGGEAASSWKEKLLDIHRQGWLVWAWTYHRHQCGHPDEWDDKSIEMLISSARFWADRAHFSRAKNAYVILGVRGPDRFEMVADNHWLTNYLAAFCLRTACHFVEKWAKNFPDHFRELEERLQFYPFTEAGE
ncbi:MAG: hypothetical protein R3350_07115, partial [Saprospiraceae bacterium]|nr:hypothetical protein [Saprospiraceae bacterium]